jgi:hypothetical protein
MRFHIALLLACILSPLGATAQTELAPAAVPRSVPSFGHFDAARPCQLPAICDSFEATAPQLPFTLSARPTAPFSRFTAPALLPQVAENESVRTIPGVKLIVVPKSRPESGTCYAIRGYEYAPADPATGGTHPTGQTTCQVASTVHRKWVNGTVVLK